MNCSHCGEAMRNKQAMDEHMKNNHADKVANSCQSCGTYFHSIRSQAQHKCKSKPGMQKQTPKRKPAVKNNQMQEDINDLNTVAMTLLNLGQPVVNVKNPVTPVTSQKMSVGPGMNFGCQICDKSYMSGKS